MQNDFDIHEYRAMRDEILLRVGMQNAFLFGLALVFALAGAAQLAAPHMRYGLALIFAGFAGMLALYWIHSGARTVQLKGYLTEVLEPRLREEGGWEAWHARRRIAGVLGSRWFISTKGALVGSQIAALALAGLAGPPQGQEAVHASVAALAALVTAGLLLKPRLTAEAAASRPSDRQAPERRRDL